MLVNTDVDGVLGRGDTIQQRQMFMQNSDEN